MVKKRIFAVLCAVFVVALSVVPCFADTWAEVEPTYANYLGCTVEEASSNANRIAVQQLVDKAYELGMFGGAKPTSIMYYCRGSGAGCYIEVMTPTQVNYNYQHIVGNEKNGLTAGIVTPINSGKLCIVSGLYTVPFAVWRLSASGDWYIVGYNSTIATAESSAYIQLSNAEFGSEPVGARKAVSYWSASRQEWREGAVLTSSNGPFSTGTNTSTSAVDEGVLSITDNYQAQIDLLNQEAGGGSTTDRYDEGYEEGYRQGFANGSPNELNIPSIFDSMFAGVRSVMTALDIEIFGISIIGTLVAVLVITIVAFVVRKLWK